MKCTSWNNSYVFALSYRGNEFGDRYKYKVCEYKEIQGLRHLLVNDKLSESYKVHPLSNGSVRKR